jgi:hypothetical protein
MIVSEQTADISPFVEHEWYDWVKMWNSKAGYPHAKEIDGQWLDDGMKPPWLSISGLPYGVLDVKLESFQCKARLVSGGHMTTTPNVPTYASVVSCKTVQIALTQAELNDLEVKTSDIQIAYLSSPCEEKIYMMLGPEFGPDQCKKAIITRALYGLKSARSSFGQHLSDCMQQLGYKLCKVDPDLWFKLMRRLDDGF